jgi:hypothetical protein
MKSKTQITPGPWRTGDMFNTVFGPKTDAPCPEVIATIHKGNRVNAKAIAAVPELIEALELAKATIVRLNRHDSANGTLDVVRTALRKAGIEA